MRRPVAIIMICLLGTPALFAQNFRDPTAPPGASGSANNLFANQKQTGIGSIIYSKNRKLVYIQGKYHKVGDLIGESRITRIDRHRVFLETADKTIAIDVPTGSSIKQYKKERR